jgi:hypothetical protein
MSDRHDMPTILPAPLPEEKAKGGGPERRTQTRFPFTASAEVFDLRSQICVNGRCSDLSEEGCYVDTLSPLTIGAAVRVRIVRDKRKFEAAGVVAYAQVPMGMWLSFTAMERDDREVLSSWIAELTGEQPRDPAAPLTTPTTAPAAEASEEKPSLQPILYALITLLIRKKIITEKEGTELLHQMFQ